MKNSLGKKLRYIFDNIMASGTKALIISLIILTVIVLAIFAAVVIASGLAPEGTDYAKLVWMSLMRAMDAGTVGGDDGSWSYLFLMLGITFFGIFIFSTLIGILANGIQDKMADLRKGKSVVIEKGHTIILGWSDRIFNVIEELVEANRSEKHPVIAILADRDKVEMEDELKSRIETYANTKVIVRSGDPMDPAYIRIVNPDSSAAIIVLSSNEEDADDFVLKSLLAIINNPNRKTEPYNIVCEMKHAANLELAKIVGKDEVTILNSSMTVARIAAQTCRQSGLSVVYSELLSFEGHEIYFADADHAAGRKYADTLFDYNSSSVIGIKSKDKPAVLNPDPSYVIKEDDFLLVVAEDDSTIRLDGHNEFDENAIVKKTGKTKAAKEKIMILGYNTRVPAIVKELSGYLPAGSTIDIAYNPDITSVSSDIRNIMKKSVKNPLKFLEGDTTSREFLEGIKLDGYQSVIIAAYSDDLEMQRADAKTMASIMHIRDIKQKINGKFSVVSEFLDVKNRDLSESRDADDFILSDKIISCILAQLSENKELESVFDDMLDADGSEIYLKPADLFVKTGMEMTWSTVVESASRKKMTALGYRNDKEKSDRNKNYGITINPDKNSKISFNAEDRIVVLSDD